MKNLLKKQVTTDSIIKVKFTIYELNLIRESLIHSFRTADWDLSMDKEAQMLINAINQKLSKFKLDGSER